MNILCIGDGDFSFILSLARVLLVEGGIDQCNSTIVTMCYESLPALEYIHGKERPWRTIHEIESLGVKVCNDVDATGLQKTLPLYNEVFFTVSYGIFLVQLWKMGKMDKMMKWNGIKNSLESL
jgi:hypothetical protein